MKEFRTVCRRLKLPFYKAVIEYDKECLLGTMFTDANNLQLYLNDFKKLHKNDFFQIVGKQMLKFKVLKEFLRTSENIKSFVLYFCQNEFFDDDPEKDYATFFKSYKVRNALSKGKPIMEKYYFKLCTSKRRIELLRSAKIDPRNLLDSKVVPIQPIRYLPQDIEPILKDWKTSGWSSLDFKALGVYNSLSTQMERFSIIFFRFYCRKLSFY